MSELIDRVHLSRYAPCSTMSAHRHGEPWFCLLLHGGYEENILSRRQNSFPGDLLFCPAQTDHSQRFSEQGALKLLLSPMPSVLECLQERGMRPEQAPHLHGAAHALFIGARLQYELKMGDAFSSLAITGLTLELLALFGRNNAEQHGTAPLWLRRIKNALDEGCIDTAPTLVELAQDARHHPTHVAREFRRHYGQSMGAYLRNRRNEKAAGLLRSTTMPLTEIAFNCGYAGSSQLSRAFRAAFGVTPSAYRRALR